MKIKKEGKHSESFFFYLFLLEVFLFLFLGEHVIITIISFIFHCLKLLACPLFGGLARLNLFHVGNKVVALFVISKVYPVDVDFSLKSAV